MKNAVTERKNLILPVICIWAVTIALFFGMCAIEPKLLESPKLFSFTDWLARSQDGILYKIFWMLGDWTECQGFRSMPGGAALVIGGLAVYFVMRKGTSAKMYPVAPVMPQIILTGFVGVGLGVILFGSGLATGWIPTFLACCTIPGAIVLTYGSSWRVWLTSGVLGCLVLYPICLVANNLAGIINMPPLCTFTILSVGIGGIIIIEIYKLLPWCKKEVKDESARVVKPYASVNPPVPDGSAGWYIRRCLADFTDLLFFGNEWVSVIYIAGLALSWFLNPGHICYGVPTLFPVMICAMFLGTSLAVFLWAPKYGELGTYNTYCVNEVMAIVTLFFGLAGEAAAFNMVFLVVVAIIAAVICPPLTALISGKLMKITTRRYEGVCGVVLAAAPTLGICIALVTLICKGMLAIGLF